MALSDNQVAYWKLDGNSNDAIGTHNGTDTGVSYGSSFGKINQGASFGGSHKITVADQNDLSFNNKVVSFSFWMKAGAQSNYATILMKGDSGQYEYQVVCDHTTGRMILELWDSSGTGIAGVQSNTGLFDNNWHHVVAIWNSTVGKIYIDGSDATYSSNNIGGTYTAGSAPFRMGGRDSNLYYTGYLDEVAVWNRALSASEVTTLYNSGSGTQYPFSSTSIKTLTGLAKASVKTAEGLAIASVKTKNGLA